jgi:NTP pyrophosphatase (non-canonical NTP hydrolase)
MGNLFEESTMTREEHLLTIIAEECAEVAQRTTKALRFGLTDPAGTQPGELTNRERLLQEYGDLMAAMRMLFPEEFLHIPITEYQEKKVERIEKFLILSKQIGKLND